MLCENITQTSGQYFIRLEGIVSLGFNKMIAIEVLWFSCRTVCDKDMNEIAERCPNMEQLDILGTREVSQAAAQKWVRLKISNITKYTLQVQYS